jgi:hypothetical protein
VEDKVCQTNDVDEPRFSGGGATAVSSFHRLRREKESEGIDTSECEIKDLSWSCFMNL